MTSEEFKLLVKGLKSVYTSPNFLPDNWSLKMWYGLLCDLDYKVAEAAMLKYICNNKFPPTIADLREACLNVSEEPESWLEGWAEVGKAIGRYGSMRETEALNHIREKNPIAAKVAERMGWRNLCLSEVPQVDRATFRQVYETLQNRDLEDKHMPEAARSLKSFSRQFVLEERNR